MSRDSKVNWGLDEETLTRHIASALDWDDKFDDLRESACCSATRLYNPVPQWLVGIEKEYRSNILKRKVWDYVSRLAQSIGNTFAKKEFPRARSRLKRFVRICRWPRSLPELEADYANLSLFAEGVKHPEVAWVYAWTRSPKATNYLMYDESYPVLSRGKVAPKWSPKKDNPIDLHIFHGLAEGVRQGFVEVPKPCRFFFWKNVNELAEDIAGYNSMAPFCIALGFDRVTEFSLDELQLLATRWEVATRVLANQRWPLSSSHFYFPETKRLWKITALSTIEVGDPQKAARAYNDIVSPVLKRAVWETIDSIEEGAGTVCAAFKVRHKDILDNPPKMPSEDGILDFFDEHPASEIFFE